MADLEPPYPSKQLALHQLLVAARKTVLHGALTKALGKVDPDAVAAELKRHAPPGARKLLARAGIRDEFVFMTPSVLTERPTLLGYYRLLLGVSQKAFYTSATGLSRFRAMEERNFLSDDTAALLPELCEAVNGQLAELVSQLAPSVDSADLDQLPLLTLGAQFDGSYRNQIGKAATEDVFLAIKELLEPHITEQTSTTIGLTNSSGRLVTIRLAADPDVAIAEHFDGEVQLNVAIEIKGGSDRSNAHNRAGEAEKSHRKVAGVAREFWTLIAMRGVDRAQLEMESPTTTEWFDVTEVLAREGEDWDRFCRRLAGAIGVAV